MAAIVDEHNSLDLEYLNSALQKSLPAYARPLFIRIKKTVDTTGIALFSNTASKCTLAEVKKMVCMFFKDCAQRVFFRD